jgi:hypothetical protein
MQMDARDLEEIVSLPNKRGNYFLDKRTKNLDPWALGRFKTCPACSHMLLSKLLDIENSRPRNSAELYKYQGHYDAPKLLPLMQHCSCYLHF